MARSHTTGLIPALTTATVHSQVDVMLGHSATSDVFFLHLSTNDLYVAR